MPLFINAKSVNEAFIKVAERLNKKPDFISAPRTWQTREIMGAFIIIENPYDRLVKNIHRKISLRYLVGEWLWYDRGSNTLDEISHYSSFWNNISDNQKTANSAYGHRILGFNHSVGVNQWNWVKEQLIKDMETRRAVLFIALPSDMKTETKDFPCTTSLQFLIRKNRLYLIANMRSNDLVLGFTYDAASFTLFQEKMLLELRQYYPKLKMGKYIHIAASIHIYKKHYEMIKIVLKEKNKNLKISIPKMSDLKEFTKLHHNEEIIRIGRKEKLEDLTDKFCNWCQKILLNKNT
jgi:thymidylate synthase